VRKTRRGRWTDWRGERRLSELDNIGFADLQIEECAQRRDAESNVDCIEKRRPAQQDSLRKSEDVAFDDVTLRTNRARRLALLETSSSVNALCREANHLVRRGNKNRPEARSSRRSGRDSEDWKITLLPDAETWSPSGEEARAPRLRQLP